MVNEKLAAVVLLITRLGDYENLLLATKLSLERRAQALPPTLDGEEQEQRRYHREDLADLTRIWVGLSRGLSELNAIAEAALKAEQKREQEIQERYQVQRTLRMVAVKAWKRWKGTKGAQREVAEARLNQIFAEFEQGEKKLKQKALHSELEEN